MKIKIRLNDGTEKIYENSYYKVWHTGEIYIFQEKTNIEIAVVQHTAGCLLEVIER